MPGKVPYVLIILDGWGHREARDANAIKMANTPVWDDLWQNRPHCLISSSGEDVGLPDQQMGNSEVGHMTLGAGRMIDQDLTRISKAISDGSFNVNPELLTTMEDLAESGHALHLMGLLSPGGVHSHEAHIQAAVKLAFTKGVREVYVHAFLDGRDVPPRSAETSLADLQQLIDAEASKANAQGGIASLVGRYFAMDRDNRWDRVQRAYALLTEGQGEFSAADPVAALHQAYDRDENDEFVKPTTITRDGKPVAMAQGDAVIFMNFRADRARELSRAFVDPDFTGFARPRDLSLARFVTLTQYADDIPAPCAFAPDTIPNSLGEFLASQNKTQLRLAETEKYAHVTFFFSGGRETEYPGETRVLVPSPDVATYDLQPEMSAPEVTTQLVKAITSGDYDVIVCNYANGDMVGHTGNLDAAIAAVECVDRCLAQVIKALGQVHGHCLITADHGNAEQMTDPSTGQAHTAHTSELVPLIYIGDKPIKLMQSGGTLTNVTPTLLTLMDSPQPREMTGHTLVET